MNPKFSIGQKVAVSVAGETHSPLTVEPVAIVMEMRLRHAGETGQLADGREFCASATGWLYRVDQLPIYWVRERCLRAIGDDEYQEVQDQQQKERQQ